LLFVLAIFLASCDTATENNTINESEKNKSIQPNTEKPNNSFNEKTYDMTHDSVDVEGLPKEFVSNDEIDALDKALQYEYRAHASFKTVIDKFGEIEPFTSIVKAEENQASELEKIYEKYELEVPSNNWEDFDPGFESISEACEGGVQVEIANIILYNSLFNQIDNKDIIAVFTSLKNVAQFKHLGAFQRCAARKNH